MKKINIISCCPGRLSFTFCLKFPFLHSAHWILLYRDTSDPIFFKYRTISSHFSTLKPICTILFRFRVSAANGGALWMYRNSCLAPSCECHSKFMLYAISFVYWAFKIKKLQVNYNFQSFSPRAGWLRGLKHAATSSYKK